MRRKSNQFKNEKILLLVAIVVILFFSAYIFREKISSSGFFVLSNESKSFRPEYCRFVNGERKCIDPKIFQFLPEYPRDFKQVYYLVYYGKIKDLSKVNEKYWKQPEIIPTWEVTGVNVYLNPKSERFGAFGFGCYPAESVVRLRPGQAVNLTTWLHTSWGVQTLQGMSLKVVYPSHASSLTGISVEQDPSIVENYFTSTVSPDVVLLGPTWPYFEAGPTFHHDGWIVPVSLDIKVHPDTPRGTYAVGIMPSSPPEDKNDEWILEYKLRYTPVQFYHVGKPYFTVFLRVE